MQDCKYCTFIKPGPSWPRAFGTEIIEDGAWLIKDDDSDKYELQVELWGEHKVNYCPMCGRKLGD
ncbi:hypothetical protein ACEN4A_01410 [Latilactobacillus sakei]|uniref:hypothetical protein n=1 Tax=Latilactobacillus sakei TaxID=1599 RepID=UPI00388ACCB8